MSKPQYIVKAEDGIVVCKISTYSKILDLCPLRYDDTNMDIRLKRKYDIYNPYCELTFTAIANLHKKDTWDETLGKRIAESKCKRKIYSFYHRVYTDIIQYVLNNVGLMNQATDATFFAAEREDKHLKELMK